jgi:hypothetical protein
MSSGFRVLPSTSETIGGTEKERTLVIAVESLNVIGAHIQSVQKTLLKLDNSHYCKY